jgi:nucleoside 2-deoxyribosyltransferase
MKSVVICGSRRFKEEALEFGRRLEELGVVVHKPYFHSGQEEWEHLSDDYKKFIILGLTHDHFYKIKMADVIFVYNKDGYAGPSTTLEIGAAAALGKPIYALSKDEELCRQVLIREVVLTPEELVKKLQ